MTKTEQKIIGQLLLSIHIDAEQAARGQITPQQAVDNIDQRIANYKGDTESVAPVTFISERAASMAAHPAGKGRAGS